MNTTGCDIKDADPSKPEVDRIEDLMENFARKMAAAIKGENLGGLIQDVEVCPEYDYATEQFSALISIRCAVGGELSVDCLATFGGLELEHMGQRLRWLGNA